MRIKPPAGLSLSYIYIQDTILATIWLQQVGEIPPGLCVPQSNWRCIPQDDSLSDGNWEYIAFLFASKANSYEKVLSQWGGPTLIHSNLCLALREFYIAIFLKACKVIMGILLNLATVRFILGYTDFINTFFLIFIFKLLLPDISLLNISVEGSGPIKYKI